MDGWIKLHRIITEWEWYDDSNTFRLFIHLLLKANSKDAIWRGEPIKRGQLITSIAHLSEELKLSVKQIRISINKLKRTNEVASARANNSTRLTINKYDSYQAKLNDEGQTKGQRVGKEGASEGQTKGDKQEGENVTTKEIYSFSDFWNDYDKKIDSKKCQDKWSRISDSDRKLIKEYLPNYKRSTPDIKYRKNPVTFLNGSCWNNAIIYQKNDEDQFPDRPPKPTPYHKDWNSEKGEWMYSPTNR